MRSHILIIALAAMGLSACASAPSENLAARLEGKTPEDRREILRRACLGEAEWSLDRAAERLPAPARHGYRDSNTTRETSHFKELCREMAELPAIRGPSAAETRRRAELAEKCGREAEDHLDLRSGADAAHMSRMRDICAAMTGFEPPVRAN